MKNSKARKAAITFQNEQNRLRREYNRKQNEIAKQKAEERRINGEAGWRVTKQRYLRDL